MTHQYKATTKKVAVIMFMGLIMAIIVVASGYVTSDQTLSDITPNIAVPTITEATVTAMPITTPEPTYPKPSYIPTLKPMDCYNKNDEIWHPCNPSEYITPNNEWVKYYASRLFIDTDGVIKYKKQRDFGNGIFIYDAFNNIYITDDLQFDYPPNGDYWINADYYLTHDTKGDCEDFAIAVTSMMLSGEMSIINDGKFIKQIIPAKAILGDSTYWTEKPIKDAWVEYQVYGYYYIGNSQVKSENGMTVTNYFKKEDVITKFEPIYQFDDLWFGGGW